MSNQVLKAEVRIATVNECGNKLDDLREKTRTKIKMTEGAIFEVKSSSQQIRNALVAGVQKEIDEGKMTMELGKEIISWLEKSADLSQKYAKRLEENMLSFQYEEAGITLAITTISRYFDDEKKKLVDLAAKLEAQGEFNDLMFDENGRERTVKEIQNLRAQKLAASKAEAVEEKTESSPVEAQAEPAQPTIEAAPESPIVESDMNKEDSSTEEVVDEPQNPVTALLFGKKKKKD